MYGPHSTTQVALLKRRAHRSGLSSHGEGHFHAWPDTHAREPRPRGEREVWPSAVSQRATERKRWDSSAPQHSAKHHP